MKKALNITLSGTVFYVEEDAYEELKRYLDSIKDHFTGKADAEEITGDIESAIAEKFSAKQSDKKQVISLADVKDLIKVMGRVEDFTDGDESFEKENSDKGSRKVKKLYRDVDNQIIAGVAAGLGVYFGVDPVIFRILFVLSVIFGGSGIVLYIILWLIIPAAETSSQKMEMQGSIMTLSEIEKNIRNKIKDKELAKGMKDTASSLAHGLAKGFRPLLKVIRLLVGISIIVASALAISGLTLALFVLLFNVGTSISDPILDQVVAAPNFDLLAVGIYFSVLIPVIFVISIGALIVGGSKKVFRASSNAILVEAWMIALIFTSVLVIDSLPSFRQIEENVRGEVVTHQLDLKDFTEVSASHAVRLNIKKDDEYSVSVNGREEDLEEITARVDKGNLNIGREIERLCIFCNFEPVTFNITLPELDRLKLSGASRAQLDNFKQEDIYFEVDGASTLNANFFATNTEIIQSGASRVVLKGSTEDLNMSVSGASKLMADNFIAATIKADVSGASKVYLNPVDELAVTASGASHVYYSGSPQIMSEVSGASKLEQVGLGAKVYNSNEIVNMPCQTDSDCPLSIDYAVLSSCPYETVCRQGQCAVVCPMWKHSPDPAESVSYKVDCVVDSDCVCQAVWPGEYEKCECVDNRCLAIIKE